MPVFKIEKNNNYTVMSNYHLRDKKSSFIVAEEHNRLTLELIDNGYIKEDDIQIFYYDDLFDKLLFI